MTVPAKRPSADLPAVKTEGLRRLDLDGVLDLLVPGVRDVPLDVAAGFTLDDIEALILHVNAAEEQTQALRWLVGGALTLIKSTTPHGDWGDIVAGVAGRVHRTARTIHEWMMEAQKHYQLDLPKGANPTRRGPRPSELETASSSDDDVAVDPIDVGPAPPIADEPPFVAAPKRPAPVKKAGDTENLAAALAVINEMNPTARLVAVRTLRTQTTAAYGNLGRDLTDTAPKVERPAKRTRALGVVEATPDGSCKHPKPHDVRGYGSFCKACGLLLTPAILAAIG